jgi:hypothetical protein
MSAMRTRLLLAVVAVTLCFCSLAHAAKLKGFYSGSGGLSPEVHRVVMIEFANDGTAIVEQNWAGKDPQLGHAHWTEKGKKVSIVFDAQKDQAAIDPLLCDLRGTCWFPLLSSGVDRSHCV